MMEKPAKPSGDDPGVIHPRTRRPKFRSVIAVVIAALAVTATFAAVAYLRGRATATASGPGLDVVVAGEPPVNSTTTIQVFSTVPSTSAYLAASIPNTSLASNGYDDQLFSGSPNSSGVIQSNLSPVFNSIDGSWQHVDSPLTTQVSLQLYATRLVTVGSVDEVYTYFNNLPYNPARPPATFTSEVVFPSTPAFTVPAAGLSVSLAPQGKTCNGGPCGCPNGNFYQWDEFRQTSMTNDLLPLAIANLTATNSTAGLAFAVTVAKAALNLSFNGDTGYMSNGSLTSMQMSSSPSWSGNDTSFQGASQAALVIPSEPIAVIGIANVSAVVTLWNYTYWHTTASGSCVGTPTGNQMATDQIDGLQTSATNFNFVFDNLPKFWGGLISEMLDYKTFQNVTQKHGATATELYTEMETASGYSSAASAYNQALKALSTLAAVVGVMTTVSDALDLIPGAGDVSTTAEAIQVLADIYGDYSSFASLFNSISFSTTASVSLEMAPFDVGSAYVNLVLGFQECTLPTGITIDGSNYSPYMPLVYVVAGPT